MNVITEVEMADAARIRTAPRPACALCGKQGEIIYEEQPDRLFGASGLWNFKQCGNQECELVWLDPMPLPEEIGKAYVNYYTHASHEETARQGLPKRVFNLMKIGYWAGKYNYHSANVSISGRILGKLLYLFPLRRRRVDEEIRLLPAAPQGRLLDVGCGSGAWLALMKSLGWHVEGIDFDEKAVGIARRTGLDVQCGSLEDQRYPNESFDAVTLNHVIEHVPDPVKTLTECARILKPGGKLVLFTPNTASLSHRLFKKHWRGLETPRHLHLFNPRSMTSLLGLAGFRNVSLRPQIAKSVIYESVLLRRGRNGPFFSQRRDLGATAAARVFNLLELCLTKWNPSAADCLGAIAVKD